MTRPTTKAVRRTANDLSDQMAPHLSHAKDTLVETVIPRARDTMVDSVLPKAKATGVGLAVRAGLKEAPKKRHPFRTAAIVGVVAVGAYAAWNAWRLPHESDDWAHGGPAAGKVPSDSRTDTGAAAGSPDNPRVAH